MSFHVIAVLVSSGSSFAKPQIHEISLPSGALRAEATA
jgi:hypothetical protein